MILSRRNMSKYRAMMEKWGDEKLSDVMEAMDSSAEKQPNDKLKMGDFILDMATKLGIKFHDSAPFVAQAIDGNREDRPTYLLEKKGCVLIISNSFKNSEKEKKRIEASAADVKKMENLWKDNIGCKLFDIRDVSDSNNDSSTGIGPFMESDEKRKDICKNLKAKQKETDAKPYEDLTADEMKEVLRSFSQIQEDYAYIVVIISTHGGLMSESEIKEHERPIGSEQSSDSSQNEGESSVAVFFGDDEKPVREKEVIELFYNNENEHIRGKPKFFIFDFCRAESKVSKATRPTSPISEPPPPVFPLMSDMLVAYATHCSHLAFDGKNGSWLITAIHQVFLVDYEKMHVLDMLTKVNKKVKDKCESDDAMSVFESSLVKDFRLWQESPTTELSQTS